MNHLYRYDYSFNAKHDTSLIPDINHSHPHAFHVSVFIWQKEIDYGIIERKIKEYISSYNGCYLNDKMLNPPIIENIAELFFKDIEQILPEDTQLSRIELSDKPTQSFILSV